MLKKASIFWGFLLKIANIQYRLDFIFKDFKMPNLENFPTALLPYKKAILKSLKPVIDLSFAVNNDLPLWTSKIGGNPYLPLNEDYPHDSEGNPLALFAQFNLAEVPKNPLLPNQGILSIFINGTNSHGMDSKDPTKQDGVRVLYFDSVTNNNDELWQDFTAIREKIISHNLPFALDLQFSIGFNLTQREVSSQDDTFHELIKPKEDLDSSIRDDYVQQGIFDGSGNHLLGYPKFNQFDPRSDLACGISDDGYGGEIIMHAYYTQENPVITPEYFEQYILLLQLDNSSPKYEIEKVSDKWKDTGTFNLFIHPKDLKNLDFSKVLFNWDYD